MKGDVMGWDVGGAHLKAARLDASGRVVGVWQEPCALWRGLDRLETALARILARADGPAASHGVTMTGEMTDLFATREEGVAALAATMAERLAPAPTRFYAGAAGWVDGAGIAAAARLVASANWHATARLVAGRVGEGLLVDIGSTTTDIIPLAAGSVAATGATDAERLAAGELVYTGVARTPLMALAERAPVAGRWLSLMAEHFATTADVYRVLGWLPESADLHDSADGGPKTAAASLRRLARMVGMDAEDAPEAAWVQLAAWFARAQLSRIETGIQQVLSRALPGPDAPLVLAGAGAFLGPRLGARLERPVLDFHGPEPGAEAIQGWCAPAVAVARLMVEDMPCA